MGRSGGTGGRGAALGPGSSGGVGVIWSTSLGRVLDWWSDQETAG